MKPVAAISVTDRYILKELALQSAGAVTPGRVMWCRDRKVLGYGDVKDLGNVFKIPKGANTLCVSSADYADVREWLG
jgi:hypothetical protein